MLHMLNQLKGRGQEATAIDLKVNDLDPAERLARGIQVLRICIGGTVCNRVDGLLSRLSSCVGQVAAPAK